MLNSITDFLLTFLKKDNHIDFVNRHILRDFSSCKKFLKCNNDLLVTKADNGQAAVIMDKDYIIKITELLNDQSTYKILKEIQLNSI